MSELTKCNFCTMNWLKARAEREQLRVLTRAGWRGGVDVFLVPHGIKIPNCNLDEDSPITEGRIFHKLYWVSWFMELGERCGC